MRHPLEIRTGHKKDMWFIVRRVDYKAERRTSILRVFYNRGKAEDYFEKMQNDSR